MSYKLCLHTTYETVELALVLDSKIKDLRSISKEKASAGLIATIDQLLVDNKKGLSDISCIIVNQGPAPFTTLRTIITTANGIAFAAQIPLLGVDALQAFVHACACECMEPIVVMLNAFNKAVYYGIKSKDEVSAETGYATVQEFIPILKLRMANQFNVFGNGAALYANVLKETFAGQLIVQEPLKLVPSMNDILVYASLHATQIPASKSLEPLYLKKSI